ncbi:unnamed protein product, partial [Hapterophycus canaliculatus]
TASLEGTIAVWGGATKAGGNGDGVLQRLQAHEKGVAHMAFCLQHSIALSAGVFVNAAETTPDVLVWRLNRDRGLLEHDTQTRLRGHVGQVAGIAFAEEELEVLTGGADGTFLVWQMPSLVLKQRFTSSNSSPLADQSVSCFSVVPRTVDRPLLIVAGMLETAGLEIFARVEKRVHEALIKAEFCPYLQRFVTVSARRATVWDAKSGEALTTLTSERLLGNDQADITAFSLDHQGHKLVVGADTGDIRVCFSHSGSVIRQLDPHDGAVNWLAFASRKTDKCVFSVGGDGALHVLDDADATGYVKPVSTTDGRRNTSRNFPSATGRSAGSRGGTNTQEGESRNDDKAGRKTGQEEEARNVVGRATSAPDGKGSEKIWPVTIHPAGREAAVVVDLGRGSEAEGGRKSRDEGWSVLLRQVVFASDDSDDEGHDSAEGKLDGNSHLQYRGTEEISNEEVSASDDQTSAMDHPSDSSAPTNSSTKPRFARAVRALMSSALREELLERELSAEKDGSSSAGRKGLLFAKPTFDMTACAADDHLSMIATAATSDGGIEATNPTKSGGGAGKDKTASARVGRPSSSLHLWDAERMALLGTLLLPCLALTRDLANAAAAFGIHSPHIPAAARAVSPTDPDPPPCVGTLDQANGGEPKNGNGGDNASQDDFTASSNTGSRTPAAESLLSFRDESVVQSSLGNVAAPARTPGAAVRAGTGLSRPALVTALMFLSPYPLVVGASTGGAVVLWRASDCVCVQHSHVTGNMKERGRLPISADILGRRPRLCRGSQAIILPADLADLRKGCRSHGEGCNGGKSGMAEEAGTAETEGHLMCLARGVRNSAGGAEKTLLYAGNGSGDIIVAHLSPNELADLSGNAKGPVPCQRRANYNPYRAVHVELTPQAERISLQAACRAQGRAAGTEHGKKARWVGVSSPVQQRRRSCGSTSHPRGVYNFAVPSSQFHVAWSAHSAAVSSLSWIDSPPSLLSSSADGLAKIWKPDGSVMLGQLDINNRRPERALCLSPEGPQRWTFQAEAAVENRQQNDLESHQATPGATASMEATSTVTDGGAREEAAGEARCNSFESKGARCFSLEGRATSDGGDNSSVGSGTGNGVERGDSGYSALPRRCPTTQTKELRSRVPTFSNLYGLFIRQLKDFEETLEASSLARKTSVLHLGKTLSSAIIQPTRKTPLSGKRWRTKSAPWSTEDDTLLERSISEQGLPTAGSVRVDTHKNMKGYVRPCPGSAEDAALKRSRSRGATGVVFKDTVAEESRRSSLQGRPLGEWRALRGDGRGFLTTKIDAGDDNTSGGNGHDGQRTVGKTIDGLPPIAILAGSHGGRLVASGITIAGDRGGGGFNVSAARAAARAALRDAALAQELAREVELERGREDRIRRRTKTASTFQVGSRQKRQGLRPSKRTGDRGASSWGWGQGNARKLSRSTPTTSTKALGTSSRNKGVAGASSSPRGQYSSGGSLAPSFGGTAHSSGSIGSGGDESIVGTEPSGSAGAYVGEPRKGGAVAVQKVRGLNEDSVVWASTRRGSGRSS